MDGCHGDVQRVNCGPRSQAQAIKQFLRKQFCFYRNIKFGQASQRFKSFQSSDGVSGCSLAQSHRRYEQLK